MTGTPDDRAGFLITPARSIEIEKADIDVVGREINVHLLTSHVVSAAELFEAIAVALGDRTLHVRLPLPTKVMRP
jgi:hypothetical protein